MAANFATYAGLRLTFAQYTTRLGVEPGAGVVELVPQGAIPQAGDLVIGGPSRSIVIPSCYADLSTMRLGNDGYTVVLRLLDRRWLWRNRTIDGVYNERDPQGNLVGTQKTVRELATLLFQALGYNNANVSVLPAVAGPTVVWDKAYAAIALQSLCLSCGCLPHLNLNGSVRVVQLGVGSSLPVGNDATTVTYGVNAPPRPRSVIVLGAETRYQSKLNLEAVGLESDGYTRKPISELSYKPSGGWKTEPKPEEMVSISNSSNREKALLSVYRWFRVKSHAGGSTTQIPGRDQTAGIGNLTGFSKQLNETFVDALGRISAKDAYVQGAFLPGGDPPAAANTPESEVVEAPFELVPDDGLVMFKTPVVKLSDTGEIVEPNLQLTACYSVVDPNTRLVDRYRYERVIDQSGIGYEVIESSDLQLRIAARYSSDNPNEIDSIVTNKPQLDAIAQGLATQAAMQYATSASNTTVYRDIQQLDCDGAIRSVTWMAGRESPATTVASTYSEFGAPLPSQNNSRRGPSLGRQDAGRQDHLRRRAQRRGAQQ